MRWEDVEELAQQLEENYEDEEIPENDLPYIHEMILSLQNFEDHDSDPDTLILERVLEQWIEIRNEKINK